MYRDELLLKKKKELYSKELQNSLETELIVDAQDRPILAGFMTGSSTLIDNGVLYSTNEKFLKYIEDVDKNGNSVFDYIRMYKLDNENNKEIIEIEKNIRIRLLNLNINPDVLDKKISNKRIFNALCSFEKELEDN